MLRFANGESQQEKVVGSLTKSKRAVPGYGFLPVIELKRA